MKRNYTIKTKNDMHLKSVGCYSKLYGPWRNYFFPIYKFIAVFFVLLLQCHFLKSSLLRSLCAESFFQLELLSFFHVPSSLSTFLTRKAKILSAVRMLAGTVTYCITKPAEIEFGLLHKLFQLSWKSIMFMLEQLLLQTCRALFVAWEHK